MLGEPYSANSERVPWFLTSTDSQMWYAWELWIRSDGEFYTSVFFPWGVDTSSLHWDEIVWNITRNTANRPVELKSLIQLKNLPIKPQEKLGILSFAPLMCKELSTLYLWRLRKVDLSNYFKLSHVFGLFQLISQRKFQENLTCNSCLNLNVIRFEIAILWLFLYTVWG